MSAKRKENDRTTNYSSRISGDPGNHNRPVRFDVTGGYVGIQEYESKEVGGRQVFEVRDRILLSPHQWKTLVEFVKNNV